MFHILILDGIIVIVIYTHKTHTQTSTHKI